MKRKREETSEHRREEDVLAFAWKVLGLLLGLAAFCLVSLPGVLQTGDPALPVSQGAGAFLLLWGLNRILAFALGSPGPPHPPAPLSHPMGEGPGVRGAGAPPLPNQDSGGSA